MGTHGGPTYCTKQRAFLSSSQPVGLHNLLPQTSPACVDVLRAFPREAEGYTAVVPCSWGGNASAGTGLAAPSVLVAVPH